jgi:hypothetical protein
MVGLASENLSAKAMILSLTHDRYGLLAGLARAKDQGISLGRRRLDDCDADKVTAIKRALAAKRGVRRIARDLKTGVQGRIGRVSPPSGGGGGAEARGI